MRYFDLHCDTILGCLRKDIPLRDNEMHINLKKAEAFDTYVQCFAVFVFDSLQGKPAFETFGKAADRFTEEVEKNSDMLEQCRAPGDLARIEKEHKHGGILTIESGTALGGDLDNIEDLKRRGVRMCTLTWNGANELGSGIGAEEDSGLTDFGREAVRRFEEAGIFVDVSHASPKLFWNVQAIAKKPIIASHSNAKAVCGHARNLTDEQFAAIRDSKGLVGLNYYNAFLNDKPEEASMEDVLRHAEHFLALGGEDVLAMGGDMDGSDLPEDMADGLASIPRLYELFLRHYSEELTDKLFYGNAARVFQGNGLI